MRSVCLFLCLSVSPGIVVDGLLFFFFFSFSPSATLFISNVLKVSVMKCLRLCTERAALQRLCVQGSCGFVNVICMRDGTGGKGGEGTGRGRGVGWGLEGGREVWWLSLIHI